MSSVSEEDTEINRIYYIMSCEIFDKALLETISHFCIFFGFNYEIFLVICDNF